jgi:asparagine synthase (glutamine-hydrolysing)
LFASELKALAPLARAAGEQWTLNTQAVYDYLSLGAVPQPSTIYEGVHSLSPGSWLAIENGQAKEARYWQLERFPQTGLSYPEVLERVRSLIRDAVRIRLRSDVPLGVFLSGGIDSTIVAYEAGREVGSSLETFTVAVPDRGLDESPVARRTAQTLGVKNTSLRLEFAPVEILHWVVQHYDQPFADASAIPSYAVARMTRDRVKVVLNGDGGDELFGGYRRSLAALWSQRIPPPVGALLRLLASALRPVVNERRSKLGLLARFARGLSVTAGERYLAWTTDMLQECDKRTAWKALPCRPTEDWIESQLRPGLGLLQTQLDADIRINLLSALLVKMDIATMGVSLEARSPLLDHVLAEFSASLPDAFLLRGGRSKAVLRDAYRGLIPNEVLGAQKRGFEVPLVRWLKTDLHPLIMDTLATSGARVRAYLSSETVDGLLSARVLRDRNWGYLVYSLLVLELWLRHANMGLGRVTDGPNA